MVCYTPLIPLDTSLGQHKPRICIIAIGASNHEVGNTLMTYCCIANPTTFVKANKLRPPHVVSFDITSCDRHCHPSTATKVAHVSRLLTNSQIILPLQPPCPLTTNDEDRFLRVPNTKCSTSQSLHVPQVPTGAAIFSTRRKSDGPVRKMEEKKKVAESLCLCTAM
ncbi:hypothetical protein LZ32DRAFT_215518 [Colletotrichum eremochloae]|nr:hypothetical protein LZ32DRAFT_215518 [Colletotrichum eremochloae]